MLSTLKINTPASLSLARSFCCCKNLKFKKQSQKQVQKQDKTKEKLEREKKINSGLKGFFKFCSYGGVAMASLQSGIVAKSAGMTPMGVAVTTFIGGMGGGSLRDCVQGRRVYWIEKPQFAWWALSWGLLGAYGWDFVKRVTGLSEKDRWVTALSLCSLGGCVCSGAQFALQQGNAGVFACPIRGAIYALLCSTGGGMMRDALVGKRPGALYPEGFGLILPPAVGAVVYQAATVMGFSRLGVVASAFGTALPLRVYLTNRYRKMAAIEAAKKLPKKK